MIPISVVFQSRRTTVNSTSNFSLVYVSIFKRLSIDFNGFLLKTTTKKRRTTSSTISAWAWTLNTMQATISIIHSEWFTGAFGITIFSLKIACKWVCICLTKAKKQQYIIKLHKVHGLWAAIVNTINCSCGCVRSENVHNFFRFFFSSLSSFKIVAMERIKWWSIQKAHTLTHTDGRKRKEKRVKKINCMSSLYALNCCGFFSLTDFHFSRLRTARWASVAIYFLFVHTISYPSLIFSLSREINRFCGQFNQGFKWVCSINWSQICQHNFQSESNRANRSPVRLRIAPFRISGCNLIQFKYSILRNIKIW